MPKEKTTFLRVRAEDLAKFKSHCKTLRGGRGESMTRVFEAYVGNLSTVKKEG